MAVHNAGAGRVHSRYAAQVGLQRQGFFPAEQHQVAHAIGGSFGDDARELRNLGLRRGHNELAAASVAYAAFCTVVVEQRLALHAQTRFERPRGVIDARVNDLAVARAGACANRISSLQHHDVAARERQCTGHGQPDNARADDYAIYLVHGLGTIRLNTRITKRAGLFAVAGK